MQKCDHDREGEGFSGVFLFVCLLGVGVWLFGWLVC